MRLPRPVALALPLALVCTIPALWPGDAPFINDEPLLIQKAIEANRVPRLAKAGLLGTRGLHYGPLPTWLYQAYLACSHNLEALVSVRALVTQAVTALGLLLLSRGVGLRKGYAPVLLASPYLWFYSRLLWDNTFLLPLGALALGAYACFVARQEGWSLCVTLACLWALPLIHLMSAAFVLPLGLHLLLFHRHALWTLRWSALATLALGLVAWAPYLPSLAEFGQGFPVPPNPQGLLFPLLGGRVLSASGLGYFFGEDWEGQGPLPPGLLTAAVWISRVSFLAVWAGMALALGDLVRSLRRRSAEPREHLTGLALLMVLAQCALAYRMGAVLHPHYYNGTWPALALLAWRAMDAATGFTWKRVRPLRHLPLLQGASLAAVILCLGVRIHVRGGTRDFHHGPTLGNQLEIVRELRKLGPATALSTTVSNFAAFPHGLSTLMQLEPPPQGPPLDVSQVQITYASGDPRDAHVILRWEP